MSQGVPQLWGVKPRWDGKNKSSYTLGCRVYLALARLSCTFFDTSMWLHCVAQPTAGPRECGAIHRLVTSIKTQRTVAWYVASNHHIVITHQRSLHCDSIRVFYRYMTPVLIMFRPTVHHYHNWTGRVWIHFTNMSCIEKCYRHHCWSFQWIFHRDILLTMWLGVPARCAARE